eukprot:5756-Pleurochrysis_carterae.AAC.1
MYDPLPRTLEGVAGVPVSLNELEWTPPEGYPDGVLCSSVPGPKAPLKFCAFDGGHCLPWQNEFCLWSTQGLFSDQDGRAYHDRARAGAARLRPRPRRCRRRRQS